LKIESKKVKCRTNDTFPQPSQELDSVKNIPENGKGHQMDCDAALHLFFHKQFGIGE